MFITIGTKLGHYEIVALLGKGGMGEVYRARDAKLKREVAIKILPDEFSRDPARVSRFQREAHVLASLNHPHIAVIYALENVENTHFLVLELVEGDTLAVRIAQGPIPIEEALQIAKQIAEALEAAQEKGIIHRDLKPANVKITPDGSVKVLDFGVAKVLPTSVEDFKNSPTLSMSATSAGVILGTPAYMAPEQARGMPVDKRADIWAFGAVLYEMMTGKQLFTGHSTMDILAKVVRGEPDWSTLPVYTPQAIRRLLKRCLEQDRKKRLPDIGVARLEIDEGLAPGSVRDIPEKHRPSMLAWIIAALAVIALAIVSLYGLRAQPETHWTGTRLSGPTVAISPRISPDGQLLAFLTLVDGLTQVAVMKPETGFWSVLTHDRSRGAVNNVCWSGDGAKLYFDRWSDVPSGIFSVPILGGDEQLVVDEAANPQVLPDGSLLIQQLNSERQYQLHRFWPETGRVQAFKVVVPNVVTNSPAFRATSAGNRVVFIGKPLGDPAAPDHLYSMELKSEKILRLAPGVSFVVGGFFPLAAGPDGQSVLVDLPANDTHRIVSVPLDGTRMLHTLLTLTNQVAHLDTGSDGSLYLDQWDRPVDVLRVSTEGGTPERVATMTFYGDGPQALPLPEDRLLVNSRTGGRDRLLLITPGREQVPFVDTQEETAAPTTLVGQTQVAFMIGNKGSRSIALASLIDRRITRRLEGSRGAAIDSMVSSRDGKTIYFAASGSIWTIPSTDGQPQKLREGDSVTLDPYRQELIVRLTDKEGSRLVRQPLAGGADRLISLVGGMHVAPVRQTSNAVDKNGRMLATLSSPTSWFWPLGLIDPETGRVQMIRIGYDADMAGSWNPDGQLVVIAGALRASLWRFRP